MKKYTLLATTVLLVQLTARAADPQAQQQMDQKIISSAMMQFNLAEQAGDLELVRGYMWADNDPDRKIADAQARKLIANYAFCFALVGKFDSHAAYLMPDQYGIGTPDGMEMVTMDWNIQGDRATPPKDIDDEQISPLVLRKMKGLWKIDVTVAGAAEEPKQVLQQPRSCSKLPTMSPVANFTASTKSPTR
jgi:hypothetical protein